MTTIPYHEIVRDDRVRQDYKDIPELAESIHRFGLIQPVVVDLSRKTLVAGGSRMKALDYIFKTGVREDTHESIKRLHSTRALELGVHFTDKPTASIAELTEMELEENIRRHQLDWREECLGIERIHKLRQSRELAEGRDWSHRRTAELLGVSRAKITYILVLAQELKKPDSPVQKATSVTDALQILTKKKADDVAELLAKQSVRLTSARDGAEVKLDSTFRLPNQVDTPVDGEAPDLSGFFADLPELPSTTQPLPESTEKLLIDCRQIVFNHPIERALDVWGPACCDGIITDWPYGIDMANLESIADIERVSKEHDAQENQDNFPRWLAIMYQLLRDNSYCVIFNDPEHHDKVWQAAKAVGFKVQRWPLIWVKTHRVKNEAAQYNFTKNFEEAVVLRKGNATLQLAQASSFWMGSNVEVKQQLGGHPFVKPYELWQWIAEATVRKTGTICDPFSGVGSATIALLAKGYHVLAGEINETHYYNQIANVQNFFLKVTKGNVEFV